MCELENRMCLGQGERRCMSKRGFRYCFSRCCARFEVRENESREEVTDAGEVARYEWYAANMNFGQHVVG